MLRSLTVQNYILIDRMTLNFDSGFSAFTGETGAGKSILIDAISILCGDRFTTDLIRKDQDRSFLEAVFDTRHPKVLELLAEAGIVVEGELILSRELTKEGKSSARINGRSVPVSLLRALGEHLVDIHSQHDTQYLLNNKTHLDLLDAYHPGEQLESVAQAYKAYKKIADELEEKQNTSLNPDELEYLLFQAKEIEDAELKPGEDEELEARLKAMMSFEKNSLRLNAALDGLDEADGVNVRLHEALKNLNALENLPAAEAPTKRLQDLYFEFSEVLSDLKIVRHDLNFDESELNAIQERLYVIGKLKKKFGRSIEAILENQAGILERIQLIENRFEVLEALNKQKEALYAKFAALAHELSNHRKKQAKALEKAVLEHCRDLYLEKARFEIVFTPHTGSTKGMDQVEFMISMNPGESLKPLVKVASGGELSRLMLGLKVVFNQLQSIETVIFDEIDSGVSGRVATAIGQKMYQLAQNTQVFSVTHLGQVAAYSQAHYFVSKQQDQSLTTTRIHQLDEQGRIHELSLILSGTQTEVSLKAAQELLEHAHVWKTALN